jgi:hypothetical protein
MYSIVTLLSVTARQIAVAEQCRGATSDFDIGTQISPRPGARVDFSTSAEMLIAT